MFKKHRLLIALNLFIVIACDRGFTSSIPDAPVSLTCGLTNNFVQITTPGQFVTVTKIPEGYLISYPDKAALPVKTQKAQRSYLGYGGLIIGNSTYNGYCAFDAACPAETSSKAVLVVKNDGLGTAVCPKCGTEYNLSNGGIPVKGESKEQLKAYKVALVSNGTELNIYN